MNGHVKNFQVIFLIISVIFISRSTQAQIVNKLYGDIVYKIINQPNEKGLIISLRDFNVQLLDISADSDKKEKVGTVLFTTYPDSNGIYVFKEVPEKTYYLRISYDPPMQMGTKKEIVHEKKIKVKYNHKGKMRIHTVEVEGLVFGISEDETKDETNANLIPNS